MIRLTIIFMGLAAASMLWRTLGTTSLDNALTMALGMALAFVAGLLVAADRVRQ